MGLFREIRLAKITMRYYNEFCVDCIKKFRDVYAVTKDATIVNSYDVACDKYKLVIKKINDEVGK